MLRKPFFEIKNIMQFSDTHIHLQDFKANFALQVLESTFVKRLVLAAAEYDDWARIADLAKRFPDKITPAFGVHPWYADGDFRPEELENRLREFPHALVGEIGVDELKKPVTAAQHRLFSAQIAVAKAMSRPVIVHAAKAYAALTEHEAELKEVKFVHHGFVKNRELIKFINKTGGYFGLSALFLRREKAYEMWELMPKNKILFETDAPFRVREENYVESVGQNLQKLSAIAGMSVDALAEMLNQNTDAFLKTE